MDRSDKLRSSTIYGKENIYIKECSKNLGHEKNIGLRKVV